MHIYVNWNSLQTCKNTHLRVMEYFVYVHKCTYTWTVVVCLRAKLCVYVKTQTVCIRALLRVYVQNSTFCIRAKMRVVSFFRRAYVCLSTSNNARIRALSLFVYVKNVVSLREKPVFVYKHIMCVYKHTFSHMHVKKRNRWTFVEAQKCTYTNNQVFAYKHLVPTDVTLGTVSYTHLRAHET